MATRSPKLKDDPAIGLLDPSGLRNKVRLGIRLGEIRTATAATGQLQEQGQTTIRFVHSM